MEISVKKKHVSFLIKNIRGSSLYIYLQCILCYSMIGVMIHKCYSYKWRMTRLNNVKKCKQEIYIYISLNLRGINKWLKKNLLRKGKSGENILNQLVYSLM